MLRKKFALGAALVILLVLLGATGGVVAGPPSAEPGGDVSLAGTVASKISYQGVLKENGNPVTGSRDMTFRLYSDDTCSTQVGSNIFKSGVQVTSGLFTVDLDVDHDNFDGQGLWLEVEVGGTEIGCEEILPAPYALSLRPGAEIKGNVGYPATLVAENTAASGIADGLWGLSASTSGAGVYGWATANSGETYGVYGKSDSSGGYGGYFENTAASSHAVYAESGGAYHAGATLEVENTHTQGIAIWAKNDSTDATLVVDNDGSGTLIKGFGGDGGEDEFRVSNDGKIETKADSYVFIPGIEFVKNVDTDTTRWDCLGNASVRIWRGGTAGDKFIYIPVTLPGVLYGQNVKVEALTVYYKCEDGTKNYIDITCLWKQTGADGYVELITDYTDWTSNTPTSYTLTPTANNTLSSDEGILALNLRLKFEDDAKYIQIGGVRLRLGHHGLY